VPPIPDSTSALSDDLDRIAEHAQSRLDDPASLSAFDRIVDLGSRSRMRVHTRCGAADTFYEAPTSNPEWRHLPSSGPTAILEAMVQTLRAARWSGYLRPDVDLPVLAESDRADDVAGGPRRHAPRLGRRQGSHIAVRILLEGLAAVPPTDAALESVCGVHRCRRCGEVVD